MNDSESAAQAASLHERIRLLGRILGETIAEAEGPAVLDRVESIRRLAKSARRGEADASTSGGGTEGTASI